jgi:hypothetical protein
MAKKIAMTILALAVLGVPMTAFAEATVTARVQPQPQTRVKQEPTPPSSPIRSGASPIVNSASMEHCVSWLASIFGTATTYSGCACPSSSCAEALIIGVGF